ncbi:SDR family oxidoreductase [Roseomonas sp. CAU 1739]|uniref:SDR family oxidoreductase n=1 Tax=Roseomonas sp. CAU 1739 TaxID=3140364 RepID=UPI00325BAC5E
MIDISDISARQRAVQEQVRQTDASRPREEMSSAMQARARRYPEPPFPDQELDKPGLEMKQQVAPLYDAPFYRGSGKLDGMKAIITGGDSGIGGAVAVLFAREGADIAIIHLPDEQADADVTCGAVEREGRRCLSIAGDVTSRSFCNDAVGRAVDELGGLNVLVNNAAFQLHVSRFEDLSDEHFDLTIKTNLYGYFHMVQACLPYLKPGSSIINTGSVTGFEGSSSIVDYSMTKGGIHAFTRALSGSLLPKGIRVNAVAPGPVWTPLNPSDDGEKAKQFGGKIAMKRPAQPEELSPAYVFLASPQMSSYITGEILPVVGGYAQ